MKRLVHEAGRDDEFLIASAATTDEEIWNDVGNPVYPPAQEKLAEHGISCSGKRACLLTKDDYTAFDYWIGMDQENLRDMRRISGGDPEGKISLLMSYAGVQRDVSDPWYTRDFEQTWQDVLAGCKGLLDIV